MNRIPAEGPSHASAPDPCLASGSLLLIACCSLGILFGGIIPGQSSASEATPKPLLTLERIFESGEFRAESYGSVVWRPHGNGYYKFETAQSGGGRDLVRYDPDSGRKEIIVPAHGFTPPGESGPLGVEDYVFSDNESKLLIFTNGKKVWRHHSRGDYWLLDLTSHELRKLGRDAPPSSLRFATFSPDARRVAYVRDNNLYVQDLCDWSISALTTNGSPTLINGTFDWVYEEELGLRNGFRWSPDGQAIAYWQLDISGVRDFYLINDTEGLYSQPIPIPYPKAGEQNAAGRIGIVGVSGGETCWLDIPGDPRNHYVAHLDWASNSTELLLQQFNRYQNTNRVLLADARTGETQDLLTETDAAWVDNDNSLQWVNGGKDFLWLSERDGWRHLYRVSRDGDIVRLTRGKYDVLDIEGVDEKAGWVYFGASPDNPTQRYLYRVRLSGGKAERVTPRAQPGTHTYNISPDAQWSIHTWSSFTNPPITDLVRLPDHSRVRMLEENKKLRDRLAALRRPTCEFFRVNIGKKLALDGWAIKPPGFSESASYPVLFNVYGEPAGQTVLDSWHGSSQLWHWMLAQQGYVIMSVDNRGTPAPRGREWRKAIYKRVGILNASEQAAAVRALLQSRPYLDPARVGIWGWSGGGTSTLNALLQYPDLYRVGMAVAPVPNLRYYDTIYEERYMGLPEENPEGYRLGSPVTHASKLKGDLLVVHGTGDDNVHYQGTEALINELIAHKKPFTMMAYPNRTHGISEGKNTTLHLYQLLTRFLYQNLPTNAPPNSTPHLVRHTADD